MTSRPCSRTGRIRVAAFAAFLLPLPALAHDDHHAPAPPDAVERPAIVSLDDSGLVTVAPVAARPPVDPVRTYARFVAHPAAMHDINANISGQISQVLVRTGSVVKKGDPIASVTSPDFIFNQRSYLTLLGNEERLAILREEGNLPNFLKSARDNLKWWGMTEEQIDALASSRQVLEQLTIVAPGDGTITELSIQPGDVIDAGDKTMQKFIVLGRVVARMVESGHPPLLEVYAYADAMASLKPGETLVRFGLGQAEPVERPISYILPEADATTQMARAIVELPAALPGFAIGDTIPAEILRPHPDGVWISRAAVLRQQLQPVAFVKLADGKYERRTLEVVETAGDWVRVRNVALTESVATSGKTVLEGAYRHQAGGVAADHGSDDHHH